MLNKRKPDNMDKNEILIDETAIQNLKTLQKKTGKDICDRLVKLFCDSTPDILKKMHAALEQADFDGLSREAHSLKSSCGNLGASAMQQLCSKIESDIVEDNCRDIQRLDDFISRLEILFGNTREELYKLAA